MLILHVALDTFRTELTLVERKVLPGLETDNLVIAHTQLNAALLAAEAAMGLYLRFVLAHLLPPARRYAVQRWSELADDGRNVRREFRHHPLPLSPSAFHKPSCMSARFL